MEFNGLFCQLIIQNALQTLYNLNKISKFLKYSQNIDSHSIFSFLHFDFTSEIKFIK